ncbi:MAG TPA: hypothetical protein VHB79_22940 [Polyangiaceae bacterium]|nr:hypothetical protein [Polyangiaceae bacterium]
MNISRLVALLAGAATVAGCGLHQTGQLYEIKTGRATNVSVDSPYASAGKVHGQLPGGVQCDGIFSLVSPENARQMTDFQVPFSDNADASVAVMQCASGDVLRCTMARRPGSGFSYGSCKDQKGVEYAMMF